VNTLSLMLQYIQDPKHTFGQHSSDFLQICLFSVFWALVIAVPLGLVVAQQPVVAFIISNVTGLLRAIPLLAFFAFALESLHLGIGFKPTVIALIITGIPPILLNTIAGLRGVDAAAIDAGRGMGMTFWQILLRIQLPLALPVIAAGVRISAVQIVATAPVAALIGGGGYGDYIISGAALLKPEIVLAGALPVAFIALAVELGLGYVQRLLTPAGVRPQEVIHIADEGLAPRQDKGGVIAA